MTPTERQYLAQQLREAADIVEHDLPWTGHRTLVSGAKQTVGSSTDLAWSVGPARAVELGYHIEAQREIPVP